MKQITNAPKRGGQERKDEESNTEKFVMRTHRNAV